MASKKKKVEVDAAALEGTENEQLTTPEPAKPKGKAKVRPAPANAPEASVAPADPAPVAAPVAPVAPEKPAREPQRNEFGYPVFVPKTAEMMQERADILEAGIREGKYGAIGAEMHRRALGHFKATLTYMRTQLGVKPTQDLRKAEQQAEQRAAGVPEAPAT